MRVSVDQDDPGYNGTTSRNCNVTLDGVLLQNCVTADEEAGYAKVYALVDGKVVIDPCRRGELLMTEVYGKVVIRML